VNNLKKAFNDNESIFNTEITEKAQRKLYISGEKNDSQR
jgi:hypothetical protein